MAGEHEPGQGDENIVIDEQPIVADKGEFHLAARMGAQAEVGGKLQETVTDLQFSNYQAGQFLDMLRETALKSSIDRALSQQDVVIAIADLNRVFRDVLNRLQGIIRHFLVPLEIDTATNMPALNTTNAGELRTRLDAARQGMTLLPGMKSEGPVHGKIELTPNSELLDLFTAMTMREGFLDNPQNVIRVFNVVDRYLRAVTENTGIGIAATVLSTHQQISHLQGAAGSFHEQAEAAEVFGLEHDGDTLASWEGFLTEIELVFAEAVVRVHELYGENVRWLTSELNLDDIRKVLRDAHQGRKALEEQKATKRLLDERAQARENSFFTRLTTREVQRDSTPYAVIQQRMTHLTDTIARLNQLIADKAKLPPKQG